MDKERRASEVMLSLNSKLLHRKEKFVQLDGFLINAETSFSPKPER
jgi:hypothetical protein